MKLAAKSSPSTGPTSDTQKMNKPLKSGVRIRDPKRPISNNNITETIKELPLQNSFRRKGCARNSSKFVTPRAPLPCSLCKRYQDALVALDCADVLGRGVSSATTSRYRSNTGSSHQGAQFDRRKSPQRGFLSSPPGGVPPLTTKEAQNAWRLMWLVATCNGTSSFSSELMETQSATMMTPKTLRMRVVAARKLCKYMKPWQSDVGRRAQSPRPGSPSEGLDFLGFLQGGSWPSTQEPKRTINSQKQLRTHDCRGPHSAKICQACSREGAQYAARIAVPMKKFRHSAIGTR
mmetsp:Transcript_49792/g.151536  ORF Transcript_49792/g.151536 Transcript_49792/m.151536 type:complete len:291 (+) Transcript_49792:534-1406(+)